MLIPLQQRLLEIVSRLPEAEGFALVGGAALFLRGTVKGSASSPEAPRPADHAVASG